MLIQPGILVLDRKVLSGFPKKFLLEYKMH